jgi:mono/diheme cytochrome c family protein
MTEAETTMKPCALPTLLAVALALALALPGAARAEPQSPPLRSGDPKLGQAMSDKDCVQCHARKFGGDPDRIYLRPDRKVRTPAQLLAQVALCNSELGLGYFPEEEEHLAAYLSLHHYKFAP